MKKEIYISGLDLLIALKKAGGEAKITPLYEAFDKRNYINVPVFKLKTAIRKKALEMTKKNSIIQAYHLNGKRTYTFKLNE